MERDSIIFKVTKDNYSFICNRNSDNFDSIFKDKYVKFWQVEELSELNFLDVDELKILEIIPISNYKRKDQKLLNEIKQKYINELNLNEEEISNKQFMEIKNNYRNYYYEEYRQFRKLLLENRDEICLDIYDYAKRIYFKSNNDWFYEMSNYDIWISEKYNIKQKLICIILKDYLKNRKHKKEKLPFTQGRVKKTIHNLINDYTKLYNEKHKNTTNKLILF